MAISGASSRKRSKSREAVRYSIGIKMLSSLLGAQPEIAPRRPPFKTRITFFGHGIEAAGAAGSAARDAKQRHPSARPQTVAGNRLVTVFRTGRQVPAGIADETGKRQLI